MVNMKIAKCPTCGGNVFKLAGKAAALCHDECLNCREQRREAERDEQERQQAEDERRHLENEEMARHFENHPHG